MKPKSIGPRVFLAFSLLAVCSAFACGQNKTDEQGKWADDEIAEVFDGIDITRALESVEAKGVTPYDFGFRLLRSGHPDKAKEWYVAVGMKTKDLKYIYGLAWMKWVTGDSKGAIEDARYILARKPTPLIRARTFYLLGVVNVDEHEFEAARHNLNAGNQAYKALGKDGGQYLCTSMLAMCAVFERNFDEVQPLLEKADMYNEAIRAKGKKANPKGRHYEILAEMRYAQGDYEGALIAAQDSVTAYRDGEKHHLADEVEAKIGLLLILAGEPKAAKRLASKLWEKHHKARDRGRLLAYNSITLMKLSLCSSNDQDAADKESAARAWAQSGSGGKALIRLLEWTKDEKNFPCPLWR